MWQMVLPMFLFRDGSYEEGFFNWSGKTLFLPPHNAEVFNSCGMTCGVIIVIY